MRLEQVRQIICTLTLSSKPLHFNQVFLTGNQWSLTIEGNHGPGEKQESDIEMQLFVKNKNNGNPNQTWKFSIKNEGK